MSRSQIYCFTNGFPLFRRNYKIFLTFFYQKRWFSLDFLRCFAFSKNVKIFNGSGPGITSLSYVMVDGLVKTSVDILGNGIRERLTWSLEAPILKEIAFGGPARAGSGARFFLQTFFLCRKKVSFEACVVMFRGIWWGSARLTFGVFSHQTWCEGDTCL